jgi:hypothetical protein
MRCGSRGISKIELDGGVEGSDLSAELVKGHLI